MSPLSNENQNQPEVQIKVGTACVSQILPSKVPCSYVIVFRISNEYCKKRSIAKQFSVMPILKQDEHDFSHGFVMYLAPSAASNSCSISMNI